MEKSIKEIWKDVEGYETLYQVSNLGNVKRLKGIRNYVDGRSYKYKEEIMNFDYSTPGYKRYCFTKNKKTLKREVHRFLAIAFIPNPENKPQVNHINGIKTDNRVENLEWVTARENLMHATRTGLRRNARSHKIHTCKINEFTILAIRRLHRINPEFNRSDVARKLNVNYNVIWKIITNRTWKKSHTLEQVIQNQKN